MEQTDKKASFAERLTEEVRKYRNLYDTSQTEYKDFQKSSDTWKEIARTLGKDETECKAKWKYLRDRFTKAKRTMQGKSRDGASIVCVPTIYSKLAWLDGFVRTRETETEVLSEENCLPNSRPYRSNAGKRRLHRRRLMPTDRELVQTMDPWSPTMESLKSNIELLVQHLMGSEAVSTPESHPAAVSTPGSSPAAVSAPQRHPKSESAPQSHPAPVSAPENLCPAPVPLCSSGTTSEESALQRQKLQLEIDVLQRQKRVLEIQEQCYSIKLKRLLGDDA